MEAGMVWCWRLPNRVVAGRLTRASHGHSADSSERPARVRRAANVASAAVVAVEIVGSLSTWAPIPIAWMWVGARVYDATGSFVADGGVVLLGFLSTTITTVAILNRLDGVWVALRRRAGHDQVEGALNRVVVASATLGLVGFFLWYYVLSHAFIIPFMPSQ